jgi:hypothetical protein
MSVERTAAGLQIVIPGCEWRSLPKSTTRSGKRAGDIELLQATDQREEIASRASEPLHYSRGQKPPPRDGLFS